MDLNEGKIDRGVRFFLGVSCLTAGLALTQLVPALRFFLLFWCVVFFITAFVGY
jgi:hypothetical protein